MARLPHNNLHHKHHPYTKTVVLLICLALFGVALVVDFKWASSSSSSSPSAYWIMASNWALEKSGFLVVPPHVNATHLDLRMAVKEKRDKDRDRDRNRVRDRFLSGAYADLPAPELEWEQMPSAPVPRLDGSAIQINDLFYVLSGYGTLDYVHSHVDVYNFTEKKWVDRFDTPQEMANSHLGVASDGRYIYVVSGQKGPQCRGSIPLVFALDTETKKWQSLPPLPLPRYAPATQLWQGRLHVMGGGKENRHTPALEHWSIAVKKGKALEKKWRTEIPIPRGGPHRACVVHNDRLFVIGGQEGDFMPKPGSPIFKCSRRHEVVYGDVYMLDDEMKWKVLSPMPKPNSHIECAWVIVNNSIIVSGGTTEKHPVTKRMILVGEVFKFDLNSLVMIFPVTRSLLVGYAIFIFICIYLCFYVSRLGVCLANKVILSGDISYVKSKCHFVYHYCLRTNSLRLSSCSLGFYSIYNVFLFSTSVAPPFSCPNFRSAA